MVVLKKIQKKFRKIFNFETWNIGIVKTDISIFLNNDYKRYKVHWFPKGISCSFIADCFGFEFKGKKYISYEYYNRFTKKGRIDIVEIDEEYKIVKKYKDVIKSNVHLSYPYPIEYKGELFFIAESHGSEELALYKMRKGFYEFEKVKTLLKGHIVDASIVYHDKMWWLFFVKDNKGWDKLFIAYSKDLFDEWKMHKKNPVKTDISSARCGGTIFKYKGKLYRPAQDCSKTYGGAISMCEIVKLSVTEFKEKVVNHIEPFEEYKDGIHTISEFGNTTLVDGKGKRFSFLKPIVSIIKNFENLKKKF